MHKQGLRLISVIVLISLISSLPLIIAGGVNAYAFPKNTDLGSSPASFVGEASGDNSGYSITSAGDVNNDGCDDILVGAPNSKVDGKNAVGKVYLILGKPEGWIADINLAKASACFIGENADDRAGQSVASAGDVNGDGFDDMLIGAPGNDQGGTDSGQVYLIFGKENVNWGMNFGLADANASFIGEAANDKAGYSVASAGNVNDDPYGDFLIGAPFNSAEKGKTYLIKGSGIPVWGTRYNLSEAENSFMGAIASQSGSSVALAGDVNNDGYSDFLIGAPKDNNFKGQVYLIRGDQVANWGKNADLNIKANSSFIGKADGNRLGTCVASAGDVNGDGRDDFIMGAPQNSDSGANAGQVYLFLGKNTNWGLQSSLSNADAVFSGEKANDFAGGSISGGHDVNGDGLGDLLIGAYSNDDGGNDAGKVYLIYGKVTGWSITSNLSTSDASFTGENATDHAGFSLAFIGDINKDGGSDFLIGAPSVDDTASESGKTYLFFGNSAPNAPESPKCDGQVNPTLVDTLTPEFSWGFSDNNAGDTQKGYQIIVSSTSVKLAVDDGDLWKTDKVSPDNIALIRKAVYAGKTLEWGTKYYWKIRTWDNNDIAGSYTSEQTFVLQSIPLAPTSPKCEGQDNPSDLTDVTPDFTWVFTDPDEGDRQSAYQILVASKAENLDSDNGDMWDSGKVESELNYTAYDGGAGLSQGKTYYWKVKTWDSVGIEGTYSEQLTFAMRSNSLPLWAIILISSLGAFFIGGAIAWIISSRR